MTKKLTLTNLDKRLRRIEDALADMPQEKTEEFDYQKPQYCDACRKNVPQILADLHAHVKHGV